LIGRERGARAARVGEVEVAVASSSRQLWHAASRSTQSGMPSPFASTVASSHVSGTSFPLQSLASAAQTSGTPSPVQSRARRACAFAANTTARASRSR
jgi:hypothetical protein